jgi:hypothetical protein
MVISLCFAKSKVAQRQTPANMSDAGRCTCCRCGNMIGSSLQALVNYIQSRYGTREDSGQMSKALFPMKVLGSDAGVDDEVGCPPGSNTQQGLS